MFVHVHVFFFVATFRVARLTLQTPKLWLVGVATDRGARHACLRFFGPEMLLFVIQQNVSLSLRSYLCRRMQDKHSCLEPKGGEIDLLLDV